MSGISKNIRKITEAWGGKTTGSGIGDAVMDLYNSLPFGVTTEMVEILPETVVSMGNANDYGAYGTISQKIALAEGTPCEVIYNGTTYKCVAHLESGAYYLGNGKALDYADGEDVPFCIENYGEEESYVNLPGVWSTEPCTLAIYAEQNIVQKLDPIFLPKNIVELRMSPVDTNENSFEYSCNFTHAELKEKLESGECLTCVSRYDNRNISEYGQIDVEPISISLAYSGKIVFWDAIHNNRLVDYDEGDQFIAPSNEPE